MPSTIDVECFFDCSSPWTYLGFVNVLSSPVLQRHARLIWRPILVGGVFNAVNGSVYENRANPVPAKQAYYQKDLADWARLAGVAIGQPPVFPVNSVRVMRGAFLALAEGCLESYALAAFRQYWGELADISQPDVIDRIVAAAGMDRGTFWDNVESPPYKDMLRTHTDALIARGGFGSPTFFAGPFAADPTNPGEAANPDREMFFGNDRIPLLEARVRELVS